MTIVRQRSFLFILLCAGTMLAACSRDPGYSQSSPEATIATAQSMVKNGDAKLLVKLIYSEDQNMSRCLNRLGHTLGSLQSLALELNRAFPEDVKKLKDASQKQATQGGIGGLRQMFTGARSGQRRESRENDAFSSQLTKLFVSPYQVLEEEGSNLTALKLDDKTYSLLYKGGPIIPAVPLLLKIDERDNRWYFVLPTDFPFLQGYFFRSDDAWKTYTGLIATLDNIVKDLTQDIKDGKLKSLDDTARVAGEKAFTSLPFAIIAIDRLTSAERKKLNVGGSTSSPLITKPN